jgi:hypothetical protein
MDAARALDATLGLLDTCSLRRGDFATQQEVSSLSEAAFLHPQVPSVYRRSQQLNRVSRGISYRQLANRRRED